MSQLVLLLPELSLLLARLLHTETPALKVFLNPALFVIGRLVHHIMFLLGYALTSGSPELKGISAGSSSRPATNQLGCSSGLIMSDSLLWEKRKLFLCVEGIYC